MFSVGAIVLDVYGFFVSNPVASIERQSPTITFARHPHYINHKLLPKVFHTATEVSSDPEPISIKPEEEVEDVVTLQKRGFGLWPRFDFQARLEPDSDDRARDIPSAEYSTLVRHDPGETLEPSTAELHIKLGVLDQKREHAEALPDK